MGRYQIPFDIHNNMKLLAAASALGLAAAAVPSDWNQFKARFGKTYKSSAEESRRFAIYKENLAFIARHNADAATGKESYTVGVNHFADLTNAEFRTQYLADMAPGIRLNYQCPVNFVDNGNTADSATGDLPPTRPTPSLSPASRTRDRAVPAGVLAVPPLLRAPCASMASRIAPPGAARPSSSLLTAAARTTPTSARTTTWPATVAGSTTRSTTS